MTLLRWRPGMVNVLIVWTLACLAATTWLLLKAGRQWDSEQP